MAISWRPMFQMADGKFYGNGQRFATQIEACASAEARFNVWTAPVAWKAEVSLDPVNYVYDNGDKPLTEGEKA